MAVVAVAVVAVVAAPAVLNAVVVVAAPAVVNAVVVVAAPALLNAVVVVAALAVVNAAAVASRARKPILDLQKQCKTYHAVHSTRNVYCVVHRYPRTIEPIAPAGLHFVTKKFKG